MYSRTVSKLALILPVKTGRLKFCTKHDLNIDGIFAKGFRIYLLEVDLWTESESEQVWSSLDPDVISKVQLLL